MARRAKHRLGHTQRGPRGGRRCAARRKQRACRSLSRDRARRCGARLCRVPHGRRQLRRLLRAPAARRGRSAARRCDVAAALRLPAPARRRYPCPAARAAALRQISLRRGRRAQLLRRRLRGKRLFAYPAAAADLYRAGRPVDLPRRRADGRAVSGALSRVRLVAQPPSL